MTTLEELAQQGDPGTMQEEGQAGQLKLMTPQQLYELWERQHWQSQEIDFTKDREDWARFSDEQKDTLVWLLSSFFIGEERVTTQFSGLVMAYEDEHEESFLATQQVDEARHMQFFDRFYREVVGLEQEEFDGRLQRVREELNEAFTTLFDEALVEAGRRLIADPGDREAKVDFVTTYHMVIEGTLALTGQHFITDYLEENGLLPGFVEGFDNVARDEHRHVAYGTWWLQQNAGADENLGRRLQEKLGELVPVAAGVLVPPGADPTDYEILGYTSDEVNGFAFNSLSRRLKAIGVPLEMPAASEA
ncbi:MAG: ribonucleotide-diphosphate reductase subunit beta [Thermoleophilaceae bacterium]|jgi:ribonucleoside-diphosphate reductase beta chain|nr:ribonucleotide-diphosphate reductase subunit beta [Thermoleophilaceae bacterium]